jgi:hypothetical protein
MRRVSIVLLTLPVLASCEIDLTGLDFSGWGSWDIEPSVGFAGIVRVDGYLAEWDEARVYFYEPEDTINPVDSVTTFAQGRYERSWWYVDPPSDICLWLGRAVLWAGEAGPLEPLFDGAPGCISDVAGNVATTLRLDYPALTQPFVLSGRVLHEDLPVQRDVRIRVRSTAENRNDFAASTSDADGYYRFETMSAAQRFTWCQWVYVEVGGSGWEPPPATLGYATDLHECVTQRRFPDVRTGTFKAVTGEVGIVDAPDVVRGARAGEARVTLLEPSDSTEVIGAVATLDDGSFHVWWPLKTNETGFPGCDWLLEVELEDERSVIVPMLEDATSTCAPGVHRFVTVE